jgi:predicted DNA-binding transcriptional regulator YafY
MSSAAQYQRRVHMQYRSRADDSTERDFDPYGLAYKQGCWYAVGWCHLRHGLRSFRLDRITQIDLTTTRFTRPDTFDALDHLVKGVALLPRHYAVEVLLHTDLATAQRDIQETVAVLEPHPDGVLLRGTTDDLEWMARMLSKVSFSFVIHTPDELRDALRQRAKVLIEMANRT